MNNSFNEGFPFCRHSFSCLQYKCTSEFTPFLRVNFLVLLMRSFAKRHNKRKRHKLMLGVIRIESSREKQLNAKKKKLVGEWSHRVLHIRKCIM